MIRRLILWFQVRSLQIMIDGRASVQHLVTDPITLANMDLAQNTALNELRGLQREYLYS